MKYNRKISKKISKLASKGTQFIFAIDFDCENGFVLTPKEAEKQGIFYDIDGNTNFNYQKKKPPKIDFNVKNIDFGKYKKAFEIVQYHIKRGDTFLVNLTFKTEIKTNYSFPEIFNNSKALFKLLYKDEFVVFSPERFIRISDNKIESFPMKGTIDANIENAKEKILNSKKEFYEHNTIVDLIRNDLNIVSKNVQVKKFRYIDKIKSNKGDLLQVSSQICGESPDNYTDNLGDIIFSLLPAGSVTGAPKEKTVEIIKKSESYDRGYYTGIFGFFDGRNLDSAVAIRFIQKENNKTYYKSGGGITALSTAENEYQELIRKIYVPII